jgi:hypothetical protein
MSDVEVEVPVICISQVPGCEQCHKEALWSGRKGHECGTSVPGKFITSCDVFGTMKRESESFHALSHEPVRCEKCKALLWDKTSPSRELTRLCRAGYCTEWYCPDCGYSCSSAGPVGCPCQSRDPKVSAIRRSYARRRKHW